MSSFIYPLLQFSALFNAVTYFVLFVLLLVKKSKNPLTWVLLLFYFFAELWSFGYFFPFTSSSASLSLLSFQLLHLGALFLAVAHFHFVCTFLGITQKKKKAIILGYIFNALISPFIFSSWFIPGMSPHGALIYFFDPGPLYHIWLTVWAFYFLYGVALELSFYKKTFGIKHVQLKYLLIANIAGFVSGSTNFLIAYGIELPPLNAFASIHGVILAYIILKYRFLDFKLTFSNWGKNTLAYGFATIVAFLVVFATNSLPNLLQFLLASTLYLFSYLKIREYFDSSHFYKIFQLTNTVHLKNVVDAFIAKNHFYEDLEQLQEDLERIFQGQFKISSSRILILSSRKEEFPHLKCYFEEHSTFLVTKEVAFGNETQKHSAVFYEELLSLGELCFPLYKSKKQLIGFFILGKKPFDEVYTEPELQILQGAAHYIALLLSAILYNVDLRREIKAKTQKLLEQNKEIKKLYELERETSAVLSHELKTPIVLLSNNHWVFSQYLQDHKTQLKAFSPSLEKFSKDMKEAIERMNTISNSIFHLREVEYQMSLELQQLNWPDGLDQLLHHMSSVARSKKLKFSTHFDLKKGTFYAASAQFEQVLTILLDNALKYTVQGSVELNVFQKKNVLFAEVKDTGPGIPPKIREQLFKRFFRGPHDHKVEGLGLGLYMAKKIMDQIGGSIAIQKNPKNRGVTFSLELPIRSTLTER